MPLEQSDSDGSNKPEGTPQPIGPTIDAVLAKYKEKLAPAADAEGAETLTHVELGDIVKLKKPYYPARGFGDQKGPFSHGIVAEILTVLPNGQTRNVSLYLYDPVRREIFLGPNGICEFVDHHCSEFTLYKRATEMGYKPHDADSANNPSE